MRELADFFGVTVEYMRTDHFAPEPKPDATPKSHYPEPSLNSANRAEGEILYQLQKEISDLISDTIHLHLSLHIIVSKKEKQETGICSQ